MGNNTKIIVHDFLKYISGRNLTELTNLYSDTIDWYIPGDSDKASWLGFRNSRQEVSDFFELLWKNTEPISAEVDRILIEGDTAVISGKFSTKMLKTGKVVDSLFFIQLTIQNNLIVRYRLLEDTLAVSISLNQ